MLRIGLTGGIGSGKSTVAGLFARHGVPIVDTDAIARELVTPGAPALAEIAARFGPEMLLPDGTLDRPRLRSRVLADPEERRALESILHPRIREEVDRRLNALSAPYAVIVVPLLLETDFEYRVDRILVVDAGEQQQIARTVARGGISEEDAMATMRAQTSRQARLAAADDVLDNTGDPSSLGPAVERLHRRYLALAGTSL
ncbi:dephospho-CoA kinase [Sulfurifustis variabilis]|uniref:Dephospho-CoA kinase n=1 Tax=Sulfurifustis variabilis TaxID=1675686 RepID=A0A1B4V1C2_9GAMM|nr:dephospho-CoA kinase [Sulfurifustis variabilis]BAU47286.1 dephospho-CoA kinase [Sulfurifustis variabilis]